jgi:alpha-1,6-mannosyltransferase
MSLKILDLNNFWSPTGGGVRRYHLEKLAFQKENSDITYQFGMGDSHSALEEISSTCTIRHYPAFKFPGNWQYRFALSTSALVKVIQDFNPDIIEIGSPYIMPWKVFKAIKKTNSRAKVVGFWHADFPVTYINRFFSKFGESIGRFMEDLAWKYAQKAFNKMDGVFVSSEVIQARMIAKGIKNTMFLPLGVDPVKFHPKHNSDSLKKEYPDFSSRLNIFYPHRFSEEKGVRTLLKALDILESRQVRLPQIFFAGTGPDLEMVKRAAQKWSSVHYLGFIQDPQKMAAFYATSDMTLALSGWETFGLSILEAMASGLCMIGANTGAASEHIAKSDAGWQIPTANSLALADALQNVIKNPDIVLEKRLNARRYAENLSWNNCFKAQNIFYNQLFHGKNINKYQ